jgi:hypothetical protein
MPNTQFDDTIYFKKDVLTVSGPLAPEEDEDPRKMVVVAFVTQHQPADASQEEKNITIAGEAQLFPTTKKGTWQLVRPKSEINPAATTAPTKSLTTTYALEHSTKWRFKAQLNDMKKGPAFGTAVLIVFTDNGTIETYSWSGWIEIDERP